MLLSNQTNFVQRRLARLQQQTAQANSDHQKWFHISLRTTAGMPQRLRGYKIRSNNLISVKINVAELNSRAKLSHMCVRGNRVSTLSQNPLSPRPPGDLPSVFAFGERKVNFPERFVAHAIEQNRHLE